jgi:hypothetical protein
MDIRIYTGCQEKNAGFALTGMPERSTVSPHRLRATAIFSADKAALPVGVAAQASPQASAVTPTLRRWDRHKGA